jgi:hypothetical protein
VDIREIVEVYKNDYLIISMDKIPKRYMKSSKKVLVTIPDFVLNRLEKMDLGNSLSERIRNALIIFVYQEKDKDVCKIVWKKK